MRYITLDRVIPGMKLAYDILDDSGRVLLGVHGKINHTYIDRLYQYGFHGIYIEDDFSEEIDINSPISPGLRKKGMECLKKMDIDGCRQVASGIVSEMLNDPNLSMNMQDIRSYDNYTYAHSMNVAILCCAMGIGYGLRASELGYITTAALLHDFGKLMIPSEILNKQGRLTPEEYNLIKSHPTMSYQAIKDRQDISAHIKVAVLYHHENVDGSGYPAGIPGEKQTIYTKILHVADVYDALTAARSYKEAYSSFEALEYLMGNCGTLFDLDCVILLEKYVPLFLKGTDVELSDGREAIIVENSGIHNLRPVVKLYSGHKLDLLEPQNLNITIVKSQGKKLGMSEKTEYSRRSMMMEG
ncbi:MAG: HD-GYP domain-containing protein [Lachnospiraceae bacterium]|nr:HD-GYP domain-containing protein [Lachnospiraceae bacterium]